jgi:hypothetical protein
MLEKYLLQWVKIIVFNIIRTELELGLIFKIEIEIKTRFY